MTKYKCGHKSEVIIMNESLLGISAWLEWKDTVGFDGDKKMCFSCYCKDLDRKVKLAYKINKKKQEKR